MRRLPRKPESLGTLDLYRQVVRTDDGVALDDPMKLAAFANAIPERLQSVLSTESTMYGWQTQMLFRYVVACLGHALLVKEEDAGDCYFTGQDVKVPDYRVATRDETYLIEVKSWYRHDPTAPFCLKTDELSAMRRYVQLAGGGQLKVAIYWAQWNLWTLVDPDVLVTEGTRASIDLPNAMRDNEMVALGDFHVLTEPPLTLALHGDLAPCEPPTGGEAVFTVRDVEMRAAGQVLETDFERDLANFFMLFGSWSVSDMGEAGDGDTTTLTFEAIPEESHGDESLASLGALSRMLSSWYLVATMRGPKVHRLGVEPDPGPPALIIADDYEGTRLRIGRLRAHPARGPIRSD
jgi:hypothetical protein